MGKSSKYDWFVSVSEIQPGNSAILGNKVTFFYIMHCSAVGIIVLSMSSCLVVIVHITSQLRKTRYGKINQRQDFALRFPLYLAIVDFVWGAAHSMDHLFLLIHQEYSKNSVVNLLGVSLWIFFG